MQIKCPIKINHLYAVYNPETTASVIAIKDFSFDFLAEKVYCIIGASGSGKSTLINFFNGLAKPMYGDMKINGIELNAKRYLNKIFLAKYKIHEFKKFMSGNNCCDKNKYNYVIQVPYDARDKEIAFTLKAYNPLDKPVYYKLNKYDLTTLKIPVNIKNKFYLVQTTNPLADIPEISKSKDFKTIEVFSKSKLANTGKRIKNFKAIRKEVGMVYQFPEYQLFKTTVMEDVMFGPKNLGFTKENAKLAAEKTLNKVGMSEQFYKNSPFGLSGGQKRRVAIAGILAIGSNILIFDEPTAGLDPKGEQEMINIIKQSKKEKKSIVVVTHSMDHVLEIADEVIVIDKGALVTAGKPYDVFYDAKVQALNSIKMPFVIDVINKLIAKNEKYRVLLKAKPKTINDLAKAIIKVKKG